MGGVRAPIAYSLQCAGVPEQGPGILNILGYDVSIECNAGALTDFDHRARREVFPRRLRHDDNAMEVH